MFQLRKKVTPIKDLVLNFLREEGYKYEEVADNAIAFRSEGAYILCQIPKDDDVYVQFNMSHIYSKSDNPEVSREHVLSICNDIVYKIKTLKCYIDKEDNNVNLSIELLVGNDITSLSSIIPRVLDTLSYGRRCFYQGIASSIDTQKESNAGD